MVEAASGLEPEARPHLDTVAITLKAFGLAVKALVIALRSRFGKRASLKITTAILL